MKYCAPFQLHVNHFSSHPDTSTRTFKLSLYLCLTNRSQCPSSLMLRFILYSASEEAFLLKIKNGLLIICGNYLCCSYSAETFGSNSRSYFSQPFRSQELFSFIALLTWTVFWAQLNSILLNYQEYFPASLTRFETHF